MAVASPSRTTRTVRRQYENFPYPHRDPADELKRLKVTALEELGILNQYCYRGKQSFRKGFRALLAGDGTGDTSVYLGQQLKETDATIVYLDLSDASMKIARERTRCRGFEDKITWMKGSLLDLPDMGLEPFDYINCSGVLHHLADPSAGLAALESVLKDDGAMGLMLYGQYGRTGVYQIQEMMRQMTPDVSDPHTRNQMTRTVIGSLPDTNWFQRGRNLFQPDAKMSESEVYDLFLHSQDRAYTVPQLYDFVEEQGLHLAEFCYTNRACYDPGFLFRDPDLRDKIAELPLRNQRAIAELYYGTLKKHVFWVSRNADSMIDASDPDNVPFFGRLATSYKIRDSILNAESEEWTLNVDVETTIKVTVTFQRIPVALRFVELIDDQRTMGELVERIRGECAPDSPVEDVWTICRNLVDLLMKFDLILLRHKSVPAFPTY